VTNTYPRPPFTRSWRQHAIYFIRTLIIIVAVLVVMGLYGDDFMEKIILSWIPGSTEQTALFFGNAFRWSFLATFTLLSYMTHAPGIRTVWWLDSEKVNEEEHGFFRLTRNPLLYHSIVGVSLSYSPLGRIFGYGTLKIERRGMEPYYMSNAPQAEVLYGFLLEVAKSNHSQPADN
jgi:hypothetical protein